MLNQFMKVFATPATNVILKLLEKIVLSNIKNLNMKVSATLVFIVNIEQLNQVIFRPMLRYPLPLWPM